MKVRKYGKSNSISSVFFSKVKFNSMFADSVSISRGAMELMGNPKYVSFELRRNRIKMIPEVKNGDTAYKVQNQGGRGYIKSTVLFSQLKINVDYRARIEFFYDPIDDTLMRIN